MSTTGPGSSEMTQALEDGLTRTLRAFRRILSEEAHGRELTQAQYTALRFLATEGEQRMSELACYLELTNSATTGLIERLEARELVVRRADPRDGRGVTVQVTETGRRIEEAMLRAVLDQLDVAFEKLNPPTRHMAVGGLLALAEAMEAQQQAK